MKLNLLTLTLYMALASFWLAYAAYRNKTEWEQFHKMVLSPAIAATVAEVEHNLNLKWFLFCIWL